MPSRGASLMAFNNSNGVKVLASGDSDDDDWVTEEEEELEKGNRRTARSKGMSSRRKRVKGELIMVMPRDNWSYIR